MNRGAQRPDAVLALWHHTVGPRGWGSAPTAWVPPDGCQDLIGIALPGAPVQWHVFTLATRAAELPLLPGARMWGYRLHPGAQVNIATLLSTVQHLEGEDEHGALQALGQNSHRAAPVQEALAALAHARSVAGAAQGLGVSERTLQRLVQGHTGQSPVFWKGLARLRQSAHSLAQADLPLAEVASIHGYADQAHLNLALRRWLGCSPAQLRQAPERLALLRESGYG